MSDRLRNNVIAGIDRMALQLLMMLLVLLNLLILRHKDYEWKRKQSLGI